LCAAIIQWSSGEAQLQSQMSAHFPVHVPSTICCNAQTANSSQAHSKVSVHCNAPPHAPTTHTPVENTLIHAHTITYTYPLQSAAARDSLCLHPGTCEGRHRQQAGVQRQQPQLAGVKGEGGGGGRRHTIVTCSAYVCLGLDRTIHLFVYTVYVRYFYREINTVIYGVYILL